MITDANLRLCTNLDIGALGNNATALTDVVDLGASRDVGVGEPLYVYFHVTETFAGLTSLETQIVVDSDEGFTTALPGNPAPVVIASTGAIATADIPTSFAMQIPPQVGSIGKRYLAVRFVCVGDPTAGQITADIVLDLQDGLKFYASGFTVKTKSND